FSSRRRHTRFDCDWSSDVCSSDLEACCRPGRPTEISPRSWVLVEGSSIGDAEFAKQWLSAALKADEALEIYFKEDSAFRQSIQRSEEHTSELQSQSNLVCRLLLEK